LKKRKNN